MSLGCLHSLDSLGLCAPLNSASVCMSLVLFLQLICRRFCFVCWFGVVFANQALQLYLDSILAEASSLQVCVLRHPRVCCWHAAGCALALVIWVLLPAEKLWDGCPHSPTMSWDKHRCWSRGGCRHFCYHVILLYRKKLSS